jgi:hypothetical protein
MGTDHPPRDKQAHFAKPSLWVAEPTDGIFRNFRSSPTGLECFDVRQPHHAVL